MDEARREQKRLQAELQLPVTDIFRFGIEPLVKAILPLYQQRSGQVAG